MTQIQEPQQQQQSNEDNNNDIYYSNFVNALNQRLPKQTIQKDYLIS
jgi:hypothetical protein